MSQFDLCRFGTGEHELFYRLPLEDRYMAYGAIGRLRGELYPCGFSSYFLTLAPHLISRAFRNEQKQLMSLLTLGKGQLSGNLASLEFCRTAPAIDGRDTGFKICSENYSYYFRCTPTDEGYDINMYAYDNDLLTIEMAGLNELPDKCFGVMLESGELVMLQQDAPHIQSFDSKDPVDVRQQVADNLNEAMGITKAQAAAMLMGAIHGFHQPCAWPWQYDAQGKPRDYSRHKNKDRSER